jgi:hyaluronan synthase
MKMMTHNFKFPSAAAAESLIDNTPIQSNRNSAVNTDEQGADNYKQATFTKRHVSILAATFLLLFGAAISFYLLQPQFEE